jgi:hypothetical protein
MSDARLHAARSRLTTAAGRVVLDRDTARALAAEFVRLEGLLTAVRERAKAEIDRRTNHWKGPPDTQVCHAIRWVVFADTWPTAEGGPDPPREENPA